ncbi:hypothetical protein HK405_000538 [Cladochytrium tenue]|nr:hypothetical protein HK405_000538 [Cladochytrium tenue]
MGLRRSGYDDPDLARGSVDYAGNIVKRVDMMNGRPNGVVMALDARDILAGADEVLDDGSYRFGTVVRKSGPVNGDGNGGGPFAVAVPPTLGSGSGTPYDRVMVGAEVRRDRDRDVNRPRVEVKDVGIQYDL